jgi:hypothetical protein
MSLTLIEKLLAYHANHQVKATMPPELLEEFPTLKKYREWCKQWREKIKRIYLHYDGYKKTAPITSFEVFAHKGEENAVLRLFGLKKSDTSLEWSVSTTVEYAKKCSRWGEYCPYSVLMIYSIRTIKIDGMEIIIKTEVFDETLNYGSKPQLEKSELWQEKTEKFKDATVTMGGILWRGKRYLTRGIMKMGGCTYHFEGEPTVEIYDSLKRKKTIKQERGERGHCK